MLHSGRETLAECQPDDVVRATFENDDDSLYIVIGTVVRVGDDGLMLNSGDMIADIEEDGTRTADYRLVGIVPAPEFKQVLSPM